MEEYFPPLGTEHQIILDERQARFAFLSWPLILGALILTLLLSGLIFWTWQGRVRFSIPETPLSVVLPKNGQSWINTQTLFPLPAEWNQSVGSSRFSLLMGGDLEQPTWLLAPRWIRPPQSFHVVETHGLYQLSKTDQTASSTQTLNIHSAKTWLKLAPKALGGGQWREDPQAEPTSFAWNTHVFLTSLPQELPSELSSRDDVSYQLQRNTLDQAFLQALSVNMQGLAAWRTQLSRVSWTDVGLERSWELVPNGSSASTTAFFLPTTTTTERRFLTDGSILNVFLATTTITNPLRLGNEPPISPVRCSLSDFHSFLRLRGNTFANLLPTLFPSSTLHLFELGEQNGRFGACFE